MGLRCTEATLRALDVQGQCPRHGTGVIEALTNAGRALTFLDGGMTLRAFVNAHPTGSYYIATSGHALALVGGVLTDTEGRGADRRRVTFAAEVTARKR